MLATMLGSFSGFVFHVFVASPFVYFVQFTQFNRCHFTNSDHHHNTETHQRIYSAMHEHAIFVIGPSTQNNLLFHSDQQINSKSPTQRSARQHINLNTSMQSNCNTTHSHINPQHVKQPHLSSTHIINTYQHNDAANQPTHQHRHIDKKNTINHISCH